MQSTPTRRNVGIATILLLAFAAGCATRPAIHADPESGAGTTTDRPLAVQAAADPCRRIAAEREHVQEARRQAVEKGDEAWKTVLPFIVVARKASSRAAVDEADRQLAALRRQAETEGCIAG